MPRLGLGLGFVSWIIISTTRTHQYASILISFWLQDGSWTTAKLSGPRQYFGAAFATPNLAVFAGGFWDDIRLNVVDLYDAVEVIGVSSFVSLY